MFASAAEAASVNVTIIVSVIYAPTSAIALSTVSDTSVYVSVPVVSPSIAVSCAIVPSPLTVAV